MTNYSQSKSRVAMAVVFAAAAALALALSLWCAPPAFANKTVEAPTQVSDDVTRLHVNKLDSDTHEYVEGATMAIIEKETGVVVDEWVTGSGTHENEKGLDVDKVYILREMAAPDGFSAAQDTEFILNATEGEGVTILSGPDAELTESYKVNLYDKALATETEETVVQERETDTPDDNGTPTEETEDTSKVVAPKTGDETPMWMVELLVGLGIVAILVLQLYKRRLA